MTDAEFMEMCRLVAFAGAGGMWTDEKIMSIEAVEADPLGVVTRLYRMFAAMTARAEAAEAKLAAVPVATLRYLEQQQPIDNGPDEPQWCEVDEWLRTMESQEAQP